MASAITLELMTLIRQEFCLSWKGTHGARHWARVRANGLALAAKTKASPRVAELFAFLHDARRLDEYTDTDHGLRSESLVRELGTAKLALSTEELAHLAYACRHHSDGYLYADISVQVCWDADRLDLGRVHIRPDPARLCTSAARDRKMIEWAYARSFRS